MEKIQVRDQEVMESQSRGVEKKWHAHTHDEKISKFQKPCQFCGKPYVDGGARWLHEQTCKKRGTV